MRSVCEAVDAETRNLVASSGVHNLFVSIIANAQVNLYPKIKRTTPYVLYQEEISQKLMCAEKLVALAFDSYSCDVKHSLKS
jgi:hypothetical protein